MFWTFKRQLLDQNYSYITLKELNVTDDFCFSYFTIDQHSVLERALSRNIPLGFDTNKLKPKGRFSKPEKLDRKVQEICNLTNMKEL